MSLLDRPPPRPPRPAAAPPASRPGAAERLDVGEARPMGATDEERSSAAPGPWNVPVEVGAVLGGKYRVERVLGVGGMGAVLAATHLDLHEIRAIKLMHASESENALAVERFLREARAAVRLKSEHVARVYDVGRLDSGIPYIVMEYLEGHDLSRIARKHGALPVAEVVHYILQACDAISEAHSLGIVHRDLKPANLFLTRRDDGTPSVKVLDFGISKHTGPGSMSDMEITTAKDVLGSPHYMSPEQMRSTRAADERSDVWALGVILYRLITGKLPFPADTPMELCARILETVPERPSVLRPDMPLELEAVILRCLEKNPEQRVQTVAELAGALLPFAPTEALEILPMSRRLALSIAPGRISFASIADMTQGSSPAPSAEPKSGGAAPVDARGSGSAAGALRPDPSADARGSDVSTSGTAAWGATGAEASPAPRGRRRQLAILAVLGAAGLGLGIGAAISWRGPEGGGAASSGSAPPSAAPVQTAVPVETAAASAAPAESAAASAAPAESAAASAAPPGSAAAGAVSGAPAAPSGAPTSSPLPGPGSAPKGASTWSPLPGAGSKARPAGTSTADPFGRSRK